MLSKPQKTALAALALVVVLVLNAGLVFAQSGDYYGDNNTSEVDNETWLSGTTDGSLPNILNLLTRLGPFVIGSGVTAQGGVGSASALLTGLLVGATMTAAGFRAGIGSVAGAVVVVAATWTFASVAIGPTWAYPVVLFVIGAIASSVILRAVR